ncbi:MAG: hypothetical protein ACYDHH_28305 [Solirubrobacteraceae bacterium]
MSSPKVALIVVSSPFEAGGDRAPETLRQAIARLESTGVDLVVSPDIVWDVSDAARVTRSWSEQGIDLLVVVHCSWVEDSLQFQLQRAVNAPIFLWSRPEPETYAFAAVKHYASVARRTGTSYRWDQGEVDTDRFADRVSAFARATAVARRYRNSRAGLVAPRTTWRLTGPMDMSYEEWELGQALGVTLLHLEMDELIAEAGKESDAAALAEVQRHAAGYNVRASPERMLFSSKVYLASKRMIERYDLDSMAVACYPTHFGLVNLATSWLGDEGFDLNPEGDVGSSIVANAMIRLARRPVVLGEIVTLLRDSDSFLVRHEGSGPASLAADPSEALVVDLWEQKGTMIEYPLRKVEVATAASLTGGNGDFKIFAGAVRSRGIPLADFTARGRGFLAHVDAPMGGEAFVEKMFDSGMDHHVMIQEGNTIPALRDLADAWGIGFEEIG